MNSTHYKTGALNALNGAVTAFVDGYNKGIIQVAVPVGFTGSFIFEGLVDDSQTTGPWANIDATPIPASAVVNNASGPGYWSISCAGFSKVRVRSTTYVNGSAQVLIRVVE